MSKETLEGQYTHNIKKVGSGPDVSYLMAMLGEAAGLFEQSSVTTSTSGFDEWLKRYRQLTRVRFLYDAKPEGDRDDTNS